LNATQVKPRNYSRRHRTGEDARAKNVSAPDEKWQRGIQVRLTEWATPEDAAAYDNLTRAAAD
jgi:hypothetical protein